MKLFLSFVRNLEFTFSLHPLSDATPYETGDCSDIGMV